MNKNNYIAIHNIQKTYNKEIALDVEELQINLNCMTTIMGYSGSGKSTFVNILSLVDTPDDIHHNGKKPKIVFNIDEQNCIEITYQDDKIIAKDLIANSPLNPVDIRSRIFGYIFQKHYLHDNFTIQQNIQIPLIVENSQIKNNILPPLLNQINLQETSLSKYPDNLSGGQAQRASILRGMAKDSTILIADEPTSSLDVDNAHLVLSSVKQNIQNEKTNNKSAIWVTHDIHLIAKYSDDIIVLFDGKIIKHTKNPGVGKEDEISSFLSLESNKKEKSNIFNFEKEKLTFLNKASYVFNYAFRELFKANLKPTSDFVIGALSIVLSLLFILFIAKITHSMDSILTHKLNNPAINNFNVISNGGSGELLKEDISYINKTYKSKIKLASGVYLAPIDIKDNKSQDDISEITDSNYVAGFRFTTFQKGDLVLKSIIKKDKFLKDKQGALAVIDGNITNALILNIHVLEELGYDLDVKYVDIKLDSFKDTIRVFAIDSILPNNIDGIVRDEFYFSAYLGDSLTQIPSMSHIVVYPKDIKESIALSQDISENKRYSISNFYELKTKIETILDINNLIKYFSGVVSLSLVILSIFIVSLSLYRSIERKRREIGVFLANGISKGYFLLFYFTQSIIYFCTTSAIILSIYYGLIDYALNDYLLNSSYIRETYGDLTKIYSSLSLSSSTLFVLFLFYFIFISTIFISIISYFISKKPVELIRE